MADTLEQAFGQVIRELRLAKGLSQEELSFACHRHRTYVSLIERGKNSPSIRTVWMLAEALKVSPSEIVERTEAALSWSTHGANAPQIDD